MEILLFSLIGVAVAAIYCVYSHYLRDRIFRGRKLRSRVAYMLWTAARKTKAH